MDGTSLHDRALITVSPSSGYELRLGQDLLTVSTWLADYVSQPLPQVGRVGPVCPFVPSALSDRAVRYHFHYQVDGSDPDQIRSLVVDELREFDATAELPGRAGTSLASLLVVLPDTRPTGWNTMDVVYPDLKDFAVGNGLMIGQFHPTCDERAVRNPMFPVSRSPIGLFAARRMAPHDVLFLHGEGRWFDQYQARFGEHFRRGKVRDPLMVELYSSALRKFGDAPRREAFQAVE